MTLRRQITFRAFLYLIFIFSLPLAGSLSYAQLTNISEEIIEPSTSPTSRVIDVSGVDGVLEANPGYIMATAKDKKVLTALSPAVKTEIAESYQVWDSAWGALIVLPGIVLIIVFFLSIFYPEKNRWFFVFMGINLLAIIALIFLYQHVIGYKRHIARIYFDNASNSNYVVMVNGEPFPIDGMHFVIKEISWTGFSGESREEIVEVKILSASTQADEIERYKIRIKMDESNKERAIKKYVYNIGGINKYTINTQRYGR